MTAILNLAARSELAWLAALMADIRAAGLAREPLLVGAMARDLLLHYAHDVGILRTTEDVDLAIAVGDWAEFSAVREALICHGQFEPHRNVLHKLRHKVCGWIDMIPFGAIEEPDGRIVWPPPDGGAMSLLGYGAADAAAVTVALPDGQSVRVVALPMLAVLKVFAWLDRHLAQPRKDASDLILVLRHFIAAGNTERFYAEASHLLGPDFDFEIASAWLVGRDARKLLLAYGGNAPSVLAQLSAILRRESDPDGALKLVGQVSGIEPENTRRLLAAFERGITGFETP
ncbi:MAG: hypothetical protein WC073_00150 [Sterolibacterium sp.]